VNTKKLSKSPAVTHETLAGDLHIITFKESSRDAVDDYIRAMERIYVDLTPDDTVRILVDYRQSGIPPIRYLITRGLAWANSLKFHPAARLAIVNKADFTVSILGSLVKMYRFGHLSTNFFEEEAGYEKALIWLRD